MKIMHEGPYRENAKPKELPLFNVNIAFKKENTHAHIAKQLRAKDRLEALEMFILERKISKDDVWSWDVVKVEEEEK
jgi:hypothetical protein